MASLAKRRDDKLRQQYVDLRFKAFQEPRFPHALYILQASLSFDALLTFWDNDPMQATFDGDTTFLEERLVFLESLYNYVVSDDLSALQLPSCEGEECHLPFVTKQFIRSTCKSLQNVTLGRVPVHCVLEAYRIQFGNPDMQIRRLCTHLPGFTGPCLRSQGNTSKSWCFARLGKICGDDADSVQSVKTLVSQFWQVADPAIGMLLLECLLVRAMLRRQSSGWIGSWRQPVANLRLWEETSQNISQACLSYMQYHSVACRLEEARRLLLGLELKPRNHAAWSSLWASERSPSLSRQKARSCFSWL